MADFRPFAEGVNLPEAEREVRKDIDIIERYYSYKNSETGEVTEIKASEIAAYPHLWDKTGPWKQDKDLTREVVIKKGSDPKLKDFEFSDEEDVDVSDEVVAAPGYQFMVVSYSMEKANRDYFKEVNEVANAAEKEGIRTFGLTQTADPADVDAFRHELQAGYGFYTADDILLKTIIRSNPGLMLLKDGVVIEKWHGRKVPDYSEIKAEYMK